MGCLPLSFNNPKSAQAKPKYVLHLGMALLGDIRLDSEKHSRLINTFSPKILEECLMTLGLKVNIIFLCKCTQSSCKLDHFIQLTTVTLQYKMVQPTYKTSLSFL